MSTVIVIPYTTVVKYSIQASTVLEVLPNGNYVVEADNALITQLEVNQVPYTLDVKDQVAKTYH